MKKIIHIIDGLGIGGAERVVLDLASRIDRTEYAVEVVWLAPQFSDLRPEFEKRGVKCTCIPKRTKLGWQLYRDLSRFLTEQQPDIVHTHLFAADVWGALAATRARVPRLISTEHNINRNESWLKHRIKAIVRKRTHDDIIAVSEAVKQSVIDDCGPSIAARLKVIPNGIDVDRFLHSRQQSHTPTVLTVVGRLEQQKGHLDLLRSLRFVRKPYVLRIVGDGALRDVIMRRAEALGVVDHIRMEKARTDIEQVYWTSDIVIVPSLWEGFGIVGIEALASGCAVIASDVDGLAEVITDGVNGRLVAMEDPQVVAQAIDQLIADASLRMRFSEAGQAMVRDQYTVARMVERYTACYAGAV